MKEKIEAILDNYREALERRDESRLPWIFKPIVYTKDFTTQLLAVFADEESCIRKDVTAGAADRMDWECGCRCHPHKKVACPSCVDPRGCMVHREVRHKQ